MTDRTFVQPNTQERITAVEKDVQYMRESLIRIETNHLVHINDNIAKITESVSTLNKEMLTEIRNVYTELTSLKTVDAKQAPSFNLFNKILEVVIIGVVGAVLGLVLLK